LKLVLGSRRLIAVLLWLGLGLRRRTWRRWRFSECDRDQPLDDVFGMPKIDPKPAQQDQCENGLNENDRGERNKSLPRPHDLPIIGVSGHGTARANV
jgi:hypothetical protein